ncbi:hypothetical protein INT48_007150 [Thamnidium elegans]|uniref:Rho-GAP domain-containing protein n=1 Tax=Thamnidium elegans TaxID=101142 RepID=A0A8H7SSX9_9FUNG|nr:hypothetical protein INT48_007150 [Thamnidium elegans]
MNEHFSDSFWSPSIDPVPNYTLGINTLHARLLHSVQENHCITTFLQTRIDLETQCAQLLSTHISNFNITNSCLKNAFDMVYTETSETAHCHRVRAGLLSQDVLEPLANFTRLFLSELTTKKAKLDDEIEEFKHTAQSALLTRAVYWSRCRALELACPEFRPPVPAGFEEEDVDEVSAEFIGGRKRSSSVTSELNVDNGGVKLGKYTVLPYREVAGSMGRMQKMIEGKKSATTGPRRFLGKDIFEWVRDYMASPPSTIHLNEKDITLDTESQEICRHLVALKFLRSVPKETTGFEKEKYYEVQHNVVERYLRKTRIRHTMSDDGMQNQQDEVDGVQNMPLEVPNSNRPASVIGGFLDRFKHKKEMDSTTKAHIEMKEADEVYKRKIKFVNSMRIKMEGSILNYFQEMETLEKDRINALKHETYDRISLFQETVKPEQDISYIIEQYKTGPYCPRPMIYENYYYGSATEQTFGVPLEEVAQIYGSYVPPIVSKGVKLIDAGLAVTNNSNEKHKACETVWSNIIPPKEMNKVCEKLDNLVGVKLKEALEKFDLNLLANLIRVYLLELPECLLTFDLYEPVKLLYATQQGTESRLTSISKLLATLPSANYHTLKTLSHHLYKLLNQTTTEDMLNQLISMFSYVLLRPRTSSPSNIHDRHPNKLTRDLLTQYPTIFTKDINKAQRTNASRSNLVVDIPPLGKNFGTSLYSKLQRTNSDIEEEAYSPGGRAIIVPLTPRTLFDDPDSSISTPQESPTNDQRLSSDVSLMFDLQEDAVEITDELDYKKKPNRSRSSTKGTMDNVELDSFFDD